MEIMGGKNAVSQENARSATEAETRNVSSCGVLFTAKAPVEIGEPIKYLIMLPKAPGARIDVRLRCVGKVVRSSESLHFAATMERYEFVRERI